MGMRHHQEPTEAQERSRPWLHALGAFSVGCSRTLLIGGALLGAVTTSAVGAGDRPDAKAAACTGNIRAMEDALARGDVYGAMSARDQAYLSALASRRWDAMADVGDAALKIGQTAGLNRVMVPEARRAYRSALFRARQQSSLDGVLRATEAFVALGDLDGARQGLMIANELAVTSNEPHARERVRALQERLGAEAPVVGGVQPPEAPETPRGTHGAK